VSVVFIPKCRRKTLFGHIRRNLSEVFHKLALQKECRIEEGHLQPDHVHMLIMIPPKHAVSQVIGFIKGKSATHIARVYGERKRNCTPACANEWAPRICGKPKVKCGDCLNRAFLPVTDEIADGHLRGRHTVGVYPMLADETCWFLAADFDKATWRDDAAAFLQACAARSVSAVLERSRSGQGAHVWIFFAEPVPASLARRLGAHLVTETMERNPDIGFASYDRFFPSQDNMPSAASAT
jgi:hypothetical protein